MLIPRFVSHLRSNAVAYLALVIALSGTAYAADKIGSKDIKGQAVGSKQLENGGVKSKDVKDGALKSKDFKQGQLPAGEAGADGAPGPQGKQGAAGPDGQGGAQGPPGPVATSAPVFANNPAALPFGNATVRREAITIGERSRIMAVATVHALSNDGGDDDEIECFVSDGGGAAGTEYGPRVASGIPEVADSDETGDFDLDVANEHVFSVAGSAVRDAGAYNVDLLCRENSGDVGVSATSLVVWAGDAPAP